MPAGRHAYAVCQLDGSCRDLAGARADVMQHHDSSRDRQWHVSHAAGALVEGRNQIRVRVNNLGRTDLLLLRGTPVAKAENLTFL